MASAGRATQSDQVRSAEVELGFNDAQSLHYCTWTGISRAGQKWLTANQSIHSHEHGPESFLSSADIPLKVPAFMSLSFIINIPSGDKWCRVYLRLKRFRRPQGSDSLLQGSLPFPSPPKELACPTQTLGRFDTSRRTCIPQSALPGPSSSWVACLSASSSPHRAGASPAHLPGTSFVTAQS